MCAGAGSEEGRLSGSHGMNEGWVNDLRKWVLVDAEHDAHFEKDGGLLRDRPFRERQFRARLTLSLLWQNSGLS